MPRAAALRTLGMRLVRLVIGGIRGKEKAGEFCSPAVGNLASNSKILSTIRESNTAVLVEGFDRAVAALACSKAKTGHSHAPPDRAPVPYTLWARIDGSEKREKN